MREGSRAPMELGDVLRERAEGTANGCPAESNIVQRLVRKFGDGAKPQLRRALYERLSREVELNGEKVFRIISEVIVASESATYKDRYFCAAVTRRLREAGYLKGGQSVQW